VIDFPRTFFSVTRRRHPALTYNLLTFAHIGANWIKYIVYIVHVSEHAERTDTAGSAIGNHVVNVVEPIGNYSFVVVIST
jgi:hypothetical protein